MARVSAEQLLRLQAFFDTLPAEQKGKCALCNETLVHIVKQAEAEVGVGTATVTNALAEHVNATARPADKVSGGQLRDRVRRSAGEKESGRNAQIKKLTNAEKIAAVDELVAGGVSAVDAIKDVAKGSGRNGQANLQQLYVKRFMDREKEALKATPVPSKSSGALNFAEMAIGVLENIADGDPGRHEAFNLVRTWMDSEEAACRRK